jgi:hypothetical protein
MRPDKSVKEATTSQEVLGMFRSQKGGAKERGF